MPLGAKLARIVRVQQQAPPQHARSVFAVELHEPRGLVQLNFFQTLAPKRCVQPAIETVVQGEEGADRVEAAVQMPVEVADSAGARLKIRVGQDLRQRLTLHANRRQGARLQRLHKARGIADRHDIFHPQPLIPARAKRHDARGLDLRVFRAELRLRLRIRRESTGEDIASVDVILMLDLPAPAAAHRLRRRVGFDRLLFPAPATDHRPVTKQGIPVGMKGLPERLAQQLRAKTRTVEIKVRRQDLPRLQLHAGNAMVILQNFRRRPFDDWDAEMPRHGFKIGDQLLVFQMIGPFTRAKLRATVRPPQPDLVLVHQS